MGRKRQGAELFVFMNGEKIGLLSRVSSGKLEFRYEAGWLRSKSGRPLSLSMPMAEQIYSGDIVENYFDNLLPDSQPIRNRIQKRFGARSNRGFDLLWHIGRDCVGAIQLSPEDILVDVQKIESEPLSDADIAETLQGYRTMPLGMREDREFRISLAGAQEKTAFLRRNDKWHRPLGTTPTSHIFKLPIGRIEHSNLDLSDSVENEWLCHAVLKAYGLPVAHTEMMSFEGVKALVVERFDRRWSEDGTWLIRLPQEDMCQALGISPSLKYESDGGPGIEQIMELLLGSSNGLADRKTFMTQVFLFWVMGAIDGHAKNFSIFLRPGGAFQLTPAYDVISVYPLVGKGQYEQRKVSMAMSLKGRQHHHLWEQMFHRHWISTAKRCNFPEDEMAQIIERVLADLDRVIAQVEGELPKQFPDDVATPIFEGMKRARERIRE
ncbi:serine/threonine protein kinase [Desulfuromonas soudanensis]|uniref:Serine/threonine protein kinase n=1 Tax=Desulfuromonas soudanensis TaxID=1603606 RepID=A0A0M3QG98_9BACT|nr:type II toxin-antitoxin system HipA family toxin [Desulfuromonas soudanensis]ALC17609.1 serine/threonine protein kinase [Desulfuromonas soudanensis]